MARNRLQKLGQIKRQFTAKGADAQQAAVAAEQQQRLDADLSAALIMHRLRKAPLAVRSEAAASLLSVAGFSPAAGPVPLRCSSLAHRLGYLGGRIWPDEALDPEMLSAAVNLRTAGERVHRLEADAELSDLGQVVGLRARIDAANAYDIFVCEWFAAVPDLQPIGKEGE